MKDGSNVVSARRVETQNLASLVFVAFVLCAASRLAAADFEYWPKAIVRVPLDDAKQWQLSLEEWLSFNDNASRFKDSQTDVWLYYFGLADWLYVGAGYKRVYAKPGDDWTTEDRPMLDAAVKTKVYGFGVVDRSRFEFRFPQDEDFVVRYRNRLNIISPVTFTPLKIEPYVAEETFVNFDEQGFNQQRFYGGVFIPLHEKVRLDLFYLWKLDKDDDRWRPTNVLGTWIYIQF
jgi:hypothetical protein